MSVGGGVVAYPDGGEWPRPWWAGGSGASRRWRWSRRRARRGVVHFTLRGYVTGFRGALVLTAIPFGLVMGRPFGSSGITAA